MARKYSRAKGVSGSTKPTNAQKPAWLDQDAKTVEQLIVKHAKTGKTACEIGMILRDSYGIPDVKVLLKKRITDVLEKNGLKGKLPEDLMSLIVRDISLIKHIETNKHDMTAKRGMQLTESKILRLSKYYKKKGVLGKDWVFDRTKAKTLIG